MTKQEEIREGIAKTVNNFMRPSIVKNSKVYNVSRLTSEILSYLHSQGVVVKGDSLGVSHPHLSAYYTVEPLIKEGLND